MICKNIKGFCIKKEIRSIAIGGFDGMHLAHQQLFQHLGSDGGIVVICTGYANLTIKRYREKHTQLPLFYYPLEDIKKLSGKEFITLLKEEFPKLQKIVVGYDFHFGNKASSDTKDLEELFDGEVVVVKEYKIDGVSVHSRVIRECLRVSKIEEANRYLGYPYSMIGYCVKGQGLGKKQFVPTINIEVEDFLIPGEGIYATKTVINQKTFDSVSFIGHRLTTDGKFACETHILDLEFQEEVPHEIEIIFFQQLRNNKKYEKYEDLQKQILWDIENAKKVLKGLRE